MGVNCAAFEPGILEISGFAADEMIGAAENLFL